MGCSAEEEEHWEELLEKPSKAACDDRKALCAWLLHPSVTAAEQSWGKTGFVVCPFDVL